MLDHAIARAIVIVVAASLILVGVAFAAFALTTALAPTMGLVGAAILTAALCLAGPVLWLLVRLVSKPAQFHLPQQSAKAPVDSQQAVLTALSAMAADKPLLAVISAGLFGAADVILKERNK